MEMNTTPTMPDWSELQREMLVQIFLKVNFLDRITNVFQVCRSWREAASDPRIFHRTLDMSACRQQDMTTNPSGNNILKLIQLAFVRGINLGHRNLTTLVFDPSFYVHDRHLLYASQRCPNLEELVLSYPNNITNSALKRAFKFWPKLKSLCFACNGFHRPPTFIFKIIRVRCPNLTVLKFSCCFFDSVSVETVARYVPQLKVLSIRCALVTTEATEELSSMEKLEELYVSIHYMAGTPLFENFTHLQTAIDNARDLNKLPFLRVYHGCYWEECFSCMAAIMGNPPMRVSNPFDRK